MWSGAPRGVGSRHQQRVFRSTHKRRAVGPGRVPRLVALLSGEDRTRLDRHPEPIVPSKERRTTGRTPCVSTVSGAVRRTSLRRRWWAHQVDATSHSKDWESADADLSEVPMRAEVPYAYCRFSATRVAQAENGGLEMDGLARVMGFIAQDLIDTQRRRDDVEFRASHRRPDALPGVPSEVIQRERGSVRRLARLVARIGAA